MFNPLGYELGMFQCYLRLISALIYGFAEPDLYRQNAIGIIGRDVELPATMTSNFIL